LGIADGRGQGFGSGTGAAGHGSEEREDVVVGRDVAVGAVIEKLLRGGASDETEIGGDREAGAGGICAAGNRDRQ
jgi:hypothetical protein